MDISIFFVIVTFFIAEATYNDIWVTLGNIASRPMDFLYPFLFLLFFYSGVQKLQNKRTAGVVLSEMTCFLTLANYVTMRFNNKFFAFSDIVYVGNKLEVLSKFSDKIYSHFLLVSLSSAIMYVVFSLIYKEEIDYDKQERLLELDDKFYSVSYKKLPSIVFNNEVSIEAVAKAEADVIEFELYVKRQQELNKNLNKKLDLMELVENFTNEFEHVADNFDTAIEKITNSKESIFFFSKNWGVIILSMMLVLSQFLIDFDKFYFSNLMNTYKLLVFDANDKEVFNQFAVPESEYYQARNNSPTETVGNITTQIPNKNVDVVVIQSEAFFDFQKIENLTFSKNITTNFRRYQKEGMWGRSFVPVVGGMTCNSEFEFLTGLRIKDMYGYQIPYEEVPLMEVHSLARDFKNYGYETKAVHGYRRTFFQRDKVYPMLGIDEFIADDNFKNPYYYGAWMSDQDIFNVVLAELDKGDAKDVNQFIFTVTVQNHGPFSYKAPDDKVKVENVPKEDEASLNNYAAGLKISDVALGEFMEALRERSKETIVVFYGDHVFSSEHQIMKENQYFTENISNKYATDYFMWSNKNTILSEKKDQTLLALSRELKKQVLPLTYFDNFLLENYATEDSYFEGMKDPFAYEAYKTVVNRVYTNSNQKFESIYLPLKE